MAHFKERSSPILYSASSIATSVSQLAAGLFMVRWVIPESLGTWQSVRLSQIYSVFLLFGLVNGLSRELPFSLGKRDKVLVDYLASSALFVTHVASVFAFIVGSCIGLGILYSNRSLALAVLSMAVVIPCTFYQNYFIVLYRSKTEFGTLTRIQFLEAFASITTVALVYYLQFEGLLIRNVLLSLFTASLLARYRTLKVVGRLKKEPLMILLKTGFPIFILDYIRTIAATADRIIALHFGGVLAVGHYALAGIVSQTLQVLPKSISQYAYPRMTFSYGENGNPNILWKIGIKYCLLATALTAFAGIVCAFAVEPLVTHWAPQYKNGIRAAQIIIVASVFEASSVLVNALWSLTAWKLMVLYQISAALLMVFCPLGTVLFWGPTLEAIASGMCLASIGRAALSLWLTYAGTRSLNNGSR